MTFQIGDRVLHSYHPIGELVETLGTVRGIRENASGGTVYLEPDELQEVYGSPSHNISGYWCYAFTPKWCTLATENDNNQNPILKKIHSLQDRFKNKSLKTRKVAPLSFPKEA